MKKSSSTVLPIARQGENSPASNVAERRKKDNDDELGQNGGERLIENTSRIPNDPNDDINSPFATDDEEAGRNTLLIPNDPNDDTNSTNPLLANEGQRDGRQQHSLQAKAAFAFFFLFSVAIFFSLLVEAATELKTPSIIKYIFSGGCVVSFIILLCVIDFKRELDKSSVGTKVIQFVLLLTLVLTIFSSPIEDSILPWLIQNPDTLHRSQSLFRIATPFVGIITAMLQLILGNSSFSKVERPLKSMDNRMKSVDNRMKSMDNTMTSLDNRMESMDNTMTSLDNRMESIDNTMTSLDNTMKSMNDTMQLILVKFEPKEQQEQRPATNFATQNESEPQIGSSVCRMYEDMLRMCEDDFGCTDASYTQLHPEQVAQPHHMEGDPNASRRHVELLKDPVVARLIIDRAMKSNNEITLGGVARWYDAVMGFHLDSCSNSDGGGGSGGV